MRDWRCGLVILVLGAVAGAAVTLGLMFLLPADREIPPQRPPVKDRASLKQKSPSPREVRAKPPAPLLHIGPPRRHPVGPDEGITWHLEGFGLREVTVRLDVIRGGQTHCAAETTCRWEQWQWDRDDLRARGELLYWFRANNPSQAPSDRGSPELSIDFGTQPEYTGPAKQTRNDPQVVDLGGGVRWTGSTKAMPGQETLLYAAVASPSVSAVRNDGTVVTKGSHAFPKHMTREWLVRASQQGSTVVAVFLRWKPCR
jgi:hypothetical protein